MKEAPPGLTIKRAYRAQRRSDGKRVLVDALWPRGISRERLRLDLWLKEIAPSAELRRWFGHDPQRWKEFRRRYRIELAGQPEEIDRLWRLSTEERVTLLYAAKDEAHNNAVVLKEFIEASHRGMPAEAAASSDPSRPTEANHAGQEL